MRSKACLVSTSLVRTQHVLGAAIASALGVVAAGCGTQPVACGGCNCGDAGSPTPFDVTYEACPADDAGTADADLDASAADAGACFATCDQACAQLKPANVGGTAVCLGADEDAGTAVVAHCEVPAGLCTGRKLEGVSTPNVEGDDLGAFFARSAWLEAVSVGAFRRLAFELRAHGAPQELVAAAKASARDEIRHARSMARLAKKHGAKVPRVEREPRRVGVRDVERVARENAVEGCVGETFGAALAKWEVEHASHADVRDAMRAVADDELRHAALGWAVAAWAETRLSRDAIERVREARDAAARELHDGLRDARARALADEMRRELWAA